MKSLFRLLYLRRPHFKTGIVTEFEEVLSISRKPKNKIKEVKNKKNNNNKK